MSVQQAAMSGYDHSAPKLDDPLEGHWRNIRARIRAQLGDELYRSWFSRLELLGRDGAEAKLSAPTNFMKTWIELHYLSLLQAEFGIEAVGVQRISIAVRASPAPDQTQR